MAPLHSKAGTINGFPEGGLDDQAGAAAQAWGEAHTAAPEACCVGWPKNASLST